MARVDRLAVLLCLVHLIWLVSWVPSGFASPDADGYFAPGRWLATTGSMTMVPEHPAAHVGEHLFELADGSMASRQAPGLAVLVALAWGLAGPGLALYLNPLLASLSVAGTWLLVRRVAGGSLGLVMALALATNPVLNFHALHGDSHLLVVALLVWGLNLLLAWGEHGRWVHGLAAGVLLGSILGVRYADILLGVGALLWLGHHLVQRPERRSQAWAPALGGLLGVAPLLVRNSLTFGAPWRTAYGITGEQSAFSLAAIDAHLSDYLFVLSGPLAGSFFGLGLLGAACALRDREQRGAGLLVLGSGLSLLLLYLAYDWTAVSAVQRFLLPTVPLWLLGSAMLLSRLDRGRVVAWGLVMWMAVAGLHRSHRLLAEEGHAGEVVGTVALAVRGSVPDGSVLLADAELGPWLHYLGRWRLADARVLWSQGGPQTTGPSRFRGFGVAGAYDHLDASTRRRVAIAELQEWADQLGVDTYLVSLDPEAWGLSELVDLELIQTVVLPEPTATGEGISGPDAEGLFPPLAGYRPRAQAGAAWLWRVESP